MIQPVRLGISADMSIHKKDLALLNVPVAVSQTRLSVPQGFDLRSKKGDTDLVGLFNKIIMKSLLVLANHFFSGHLSSPRMAHSAKRIAQRVRKRITHIILANPGD